MEPWQKDYIRKNLVALTSTTIGRRRILDALIGKQKISQSEYQKLERILDREGTDDHASEMYRILPSRVGAYNVLLEILVAENQTEPAGILENGLKLYKLIEATTKNKDAIEQLWSQGYLTLSGHETFKKQLNTAVSDRHTGNLFTILLKLVDSRLSIDKLIEFLENVNPTEPVPQKKQKLQESDDDEALIHAAVPSGSVEPDALDPEYKAYTKKAAKNALTVKVEKPKSCMRTLFGKKDDYNLPDGKKGLALIINIISYKKKGKNGKEIDQSRRGAEHDGRYMRELWKQLGYEIFKEDKIDWDKGIWNKKEVIDTVNEFQSHCNQQPPDSIVIYIGAHGKYNKITTSDFEKVFLYSHIVRKFYHGLKPAKGKNPSKPLGCPGLEGKPKIILVNACQVFEAEQSDAVLKTPVSDMVVCTAQAPGFKAWRNTRKGSWFTHCLTYVLMKYAKEKSFMEMLRLVSQYLEKVQKSVGKRETSTGKLVPLEHGQIPEIRDKGMKDLYFFMPT